MPKDKRTKENTDKEIDEKDKVIKIENIQINNELEEENMKKNELEFENLNIEKEKEREKEDEEKEEEEEQKSIEEENNIINDELEKENEIKDEMQKLNITDIYTADNLNYFNKDNGSKKQIDESINYYSSL